MVEHMSEWDASVVDSAVDWLVTSGEPGRLEIRCSGPDEMLRVWRRVVATVATNQAVAYHAATAEAVCRATGRHLSVRCS